MISIFDVNCEEKLSINLPEISLVWYNSGRFLPRIELPALPLKSWVLEFHFGDTAICLFWRSRYFLHTFWEKFARKYYLLNLFRDHFSHTSRSFPRPIPPCFREFSETRRIADYYIYLRKVVTSEVAEVVGVVCFVPKLQVSWASYLLCLTSWACCGVIAYLQLLNSVSETFRTC